MSRFPPPFILSMSLSLLFLIVVSTQVNVCSMNATISHDCFCCCNDEPTMSSSRILAALSSHFHQTCCRGAPFGLLQPVAALRLGPLRPSTRRRAVLRFGPLRPSTPCFFSQSAQWLTPVAIRPLPFLPSSLPGRVAFYLLFRSLLLSRALQSPPSTSTTSSRKLLLIVRLLKLPRAL